MPNERELKYLEILKPQLFKALLDEPVDPQYSKSGLDGYDNFKNSITNYTDVSLSDCVRFDIALLIQHLSGLLAANVQDVDVRFIVKDEKLTVMFCAKNTTGAKGEYPAYDKGDVNPVS